MSDEELAAIDAAIRNYENDPEPMEPFLAGCAVELRAEVRRLREAIAALAPGDVVCSVPGCGEGVARFCQDHE